MSTDPTVTNPGLYSVVMENERVRVLEYHDRPGDRAGAGPRPHSQPWSRSDGMTSAAIRSRARS